jgi:D-serine deaminase-like pyridoxal phosphate-dependent protein
MVARVATIDAPVRNPRKADLIASARERLEVLDTAGPVALFGASAHGFTDDLGAQRLDVEDVVAVGGKAVALLVQRGRGTDDLWVERRLSAVFDADTEPVLHGSWVSGLDSASRI